MTNNTFNAKRKMTDTRDLYARQVMVSLGNEIKLCCRKLTIESEPSTTKIINLPNVIMRTLGKDEIEKISQELNNCITTITEFTEGFNKKNYLLFSKNSIFCMHLRPKKMIQELMQSYSTNKNLKFINEELRDNIIYQISLDLNRMKLLINQTECTTREDFDKFVDKFHKYYHSNMQSLYYLIIMLCTQASFYYPYHIVSDIYNLPDHNIFVIPDEDYPLVSITHNDKNVELVFKKTLKYMNVDTYKIFTRIYAFLVVTINLKDNYKDCVVSGQSYAECSKSVIYWFKESDVVVI